MDETRNVIIVGGACPSCGQALCAEHNGSRPDPGGMNVGCLHGRETVVLASGGLRAIRTRVAA